MAEYIKRQSVHAMVKSLKQYSWTSPVSNETHVTVAVDDMALEIDKIPAADAVRVVRCKNCEYGKDAKVNKKGYRICPASHMEITDDDFCSYGERKST